MKPKILLVKHFDHVILVVLSLLFLFAVYKAFIESDPTLDKIKSEIQRYDKTIQAAMRSEEFTPSVIPNYLEQLETRFDRSPVVSPYARNPFFPGKRILHPALDLKVGQSTERIFPKIELRPSTIEEANEVVNVTVTYSVEENKSTVSMVAAKAGSGELTIVDSRFQTHVWPLFVREPMRLDPPNPLLEVTFDVMPPTERKADGSGESKPARVLIVGIPDNPDSLSEGVGRTTHVKIERKQADLTDLYYETVTPEIHLRPATQEKIEDIWADFRAPEEPLDSGRDATMELPGRSTISEGGWELPPETAEPRRGLDDGGQTQVSQGKPFAGTFVYLDATVDPGESYVYRLTSIYWAEGEDPLPCKDQFVSWPVPVPALVSFRYVGGTSVEITRPDPRSAGDLTEVFSFAPGMPIRGRKQISYEVNIDNNSITEREWVDFSTNVIFVDTLSSLATVTYRSVRYVPREKKFVFRARESKTQMLFYLSGQGSLRSKVREDRRESGSSTGGSLTEPRSDERRPSSGRSRGIGGSDSPPGMQPDRRRPR